MRWFLPGMLCIRWARMKPISALKITEVTANRQLWKMTSWKVLRFSRNAKLRQTDERGHLLVQHAEVDRVERRIDHEAGDQQDQRQAQKERDRRSLLGEAPQTAGPAGPRHGWRHHANGNARAVRHTIYPPLPGAIGGTCHRPTLTLGLLLRTSGCARPEIGCARPEIRRAGRWADHWSPGRDGQRCETQCGPAISVLPMRPGSTKTQSRNQTPAHVAISIARPAEFPRLESRQGITRSCCCFPDTLAAGAAMCNASFAQVSHETVPRSPVVGPGAAV